MANPVSNPAGYPLSIARVGKPIGNINDIKAALASSSGSSASDTLKKYEQEKANYEKTKARLESWGKLQDNKYNPVDRNEQKAYNELQRAETNLKNAEKAYKQEQEYYNQQLNELKKAGLINKNNQITINNLEQQRKYDLLKAQEKRVNSAAESYNKNVSGYESLVSKYENYGYIQDNKFNFIDSDDKMNIAALNQSASVVNSYANLYNMQAFGENIKSQKTITNTPVNKMDLNPVPVANFIYGRITGQSSEELKKQTVDVYNQPGYEPIVIPGQQVIGRYTKTKLTDIEQNPIFGFGNLALDFAVPYSFSKIPTIANTAASAITKRTAEKEILKESAKISKKSVGGASLIDSSGEAFAMSGNAYSIMNMNSDLLLKTGVAGVSAGLGYEVLTRTDIQMPEFPEFPDIGNNIFPTGQDEIIYDGRQDIIPTRENSEFTDYLPPDITSKNNNISEIIPQENYFNLEIEPRTMYNNYKEIKPFSEYFRQEIIPNVNQKSTNPRLMKASADIIYNSGSGVGLYRNPASPGFPQFPDMYDFINIPEEKIKSKKQISDIQKDQVIVEYNNPYNLGELPAKTKTKTKTKKQTVNTISDDYMSSVSSLMQAFSGKLNVPFAGVISSDKSKSKSDNMSKLDSLSLIDSLALTDAFADAAALSMAGAMGISASQAYTSINFTAPAYMPQSSNQSKNVNRNKNQDEYFFEYNYFSQERGRKRKLDYDKKKQKKGSKNKNKTDNSWDLYYGMNPFNIFR